MQNSRRILLGCVAALALLPLLVPAQDTDAQAKARQALEKQMTNPPPPPAAKAPANPAPAQPAKPAPAPAPAAKPAATPPPPQPVAATSTNSLENALHQTITDLRAQPTQQGSGPWTVQMPAAADSDEISKAREAMRQKISDLSNQPETPPAQLNPHDAAVYLAVKDAEKRQRAAELERKAAAVSEPPPMPDLSGPVPPISAVKQEKLDALLRQYETDQISPEQYHDQRAKILAGP